MSDEVLLLRGFLAEILMWVGVASMVAVAFIAVLDAVYVRRLPFGRLGILLILSVGLLLIGWIMLDTQRPPLFAFMAKLIATAGVLLGCGLMFAPLAVRRSLIFQPKDYVLVLGGGLVAAAGLYCVRSKRAV